MFARCAYQSFIYLNANSISLSFSITRLARNGVARASVRRPPSWTRQTSRRTPHEKMAATASITKLSTNRKSKFCVLKSQTPRYYKSYVFFCFCLFRADNDKLKMALRKKDEEVVTLKAALDRFTTAVRARDHTNAFLFCF